MFVCCLFVFLPGERVVMNSVVKKKGCILRVCIRTAMGTAFTDLVRRIVSDIMAVYVCRGFPFFKQSICIRACDYKMFKIRQWIEH